MNHALEAVKRQSEKQKRQRDNWKARCLAERAVAGRLLEYITGSCPLEVYGWDHPKTCKVACRARRQESEATCWGLYIEEQARKEPNYRQEEAR
jgi:hypothetical protein